MTLRRVVSLMSCALLLGLIVTAGGREAVAEDTDTCLLFATFHGNGESGLHLVWSDDGVNWKSIQNDKSFLRSNVGARIMRDPSLVQSPDGVFHMVWTSGWWEKGIGYANSNDLVNWSEPVALPVMAHEPRAEMCWAPEIRWDEEAQVFLIYWSSSLNGETATSAGQHGPRYFRTYATTTADFKKFTPTRMFFDPKTPKGEKGEGGQIDASTAKFGDKYYIFYKEGYNPGGIRYASADTLQGPYKKIFPMFAQDNQDPNDENYIIWEGPTAIQIGDYCVVYNDCGKKKNPSERMGAWRSKDMIHWEDIRVQTSFPAWTQHGSVLRVPRSVVQSLDASAARSTTISIDPAKTVNSIDEKVYGHFLEHIYRSCNGGLWGDLVWNRSFEHNAADGSVSHNWTAYGPGKAKLVDDNPLNSRFCQQIVAETGETGLQQTPICIRQGETYRGSLWARGEAAEGLVVRLLDGSQTLAETALPRPTAEWREYPFEFKPMRSVDNATLQIGVRGKADVGLDQISIMPESWAKAGGFRPDLVEAVAELRPPVVRWPGGCYACWYRWKDGIGPQHKRQASFVEAWEDHDVNSLGTDEFMALCRKVGSEPLLVVNIGWHAQFRRDYPNVTADELVQDILDWIEYCNGPADSKWGKVRAANGHPEPYNVKYWEIDNEAWAMGAEGYADAVRKIAPLMKKADPSIKVVACGSAGYAQRPMGLPWNKYIIDHCADLIDYLSLHHYEPPNGFADGPSRYEDFFEKTGELIRQSKNPNMKIYISEWSVQTTDWRTGLYAGGLLNSFERCGDFLAIGGPALFLRHTSTKNQEWKAFVNFDHRTWFPAPNYVVMKLWRDHYAPLRIEMTGDPGKLNAIATKSNDGTKLHFKAVNPSPEPVAVILNVKAGFDVGKAELELVAPDSLDAQNTLDNPHVVRPVVGVVERKGAALRFMLPRWSAAVLAIQSKTNTEK